MAIHLLTLAFLITLSFTKYFEIALAIIGLSDWRRTHQMQVKLQAVPNELKLDRHLIVLSFSQHRFFVIKVIELSKQFSNRKPLNPIFTSIFNKTWNVAIKNACKEILGMNHASFYLSWEILPELTKGHYRLR